MKYIIVRYVVSILLSSVTVKIHRPFCHNPHSFDSIKFKLDTRSIRTEQFKISMTASVIQKHCHSLVRRLSGRKKFNDSNFVLTLQFLISVDRLMKLYIYIKH